MRLKALSLLAAVSLLAACETAPDNGANTAGSASGTQTTGTTTSGVRPGSEQDFVANVGDRVWFAYDKSVVTGEGRKILERQADWLKKYPNVTVTVEGHCDERGTREYNLALGERRATAVKNVLVALGIPANRMTTISYGKERPAVVGSNEAAWAQNRRGVTVVN
jgi:peptidoglycan-associated lipoprotein